MIQVGVIGAGGMGQAVVVSAVETYFFYTVPNVIFSY